MLDRSIKQFSFAQKGCNVTVPIKDVERGRGDFRNILAMVKEVNDNGTYTLCTKMERFSNCTHEIRLHRVETTPLYQ